MGCSKNMDGKEELPTTQIQDQQTETEEPSGDSNAFFNENTSGDMVYGNDSAHYSHGGMVCEADGELFFVDVNKDLVRVHDKDESVIAQNVAGGLNIYQDRVYYISEEDQTAYSATFSGEDKTPVIEDSVYSLLVCDQGMVYTDYDNHLYLMDLDGNLLQISDKTCLWGNYYGQWLLYAEIGEAKSCPVKAFGFKEHKDVTLLDYGLYPVVYDSKLLYQGQDGMVAEMNLKNGESKVVTNDWGQNIVLIKDTLFYTNGDCIYKKSGDADSEIIYENKDAVIESMWECREWLIFTERDSDTVWKGYDLESGEIVDYEEIAW